MLRWARGGDRPCYELNSGAEFKLLIWPTLAFAVSEIPTRHLSKSSSSKACCQNRTVEPINHCG